MTTDDEYIVEMWGAGSGAGLVGGDTYAVAGAGVGVDPELVLALGDLIKKLRRKQLLKPKKRKRLSPGKVSRIVSAVLSAKQAI